MVTSQEYAGLRMSKFKNKKIDGSICDRCQNEFKEWERVNLVIRVGFAGIFHIGECPKRNEPREQLGLF